MELLNKKIDLKNIFYSSLPGFFSIIFTLVSIPIYLNNLTPLVYSSFIISHIFLSLSLLLSLNIGKVTSIYIQNKSFLFKNKIISNAFHISLFSAFFLSLIAVFFLYLFFSKNNELNFYYIFFGLFGSTIFINLEAINKGLKKFKVVALSNFFFYGFSISAPALFLIKKNDIVEFNNEDLFLISIIIKFFSLFLILFSIIKNVHFKFSFNKNLIDFLKQQTLWMTLSNVYNQIFDYLDKYLIKFFLSPLIFINYTIAQQIASKLTILSGAIISVCLPNFSAQKVLSNKKKFFNLYFFLFYIPISILIIFFNSYFENILQWWLKDKFNPDFFILFNFFLTLTFIACMSHIIIAFYEANYIAKKNSLVETFILFPFLIFLVFFIINGNIFFVCYLILLKEFILFLIRLIIIKNYLFLYKFFFLSLSLFLLSLLLKFNNFYSFSYFVKILFVISIIKLFFDLNKIFNPK